MSSKAKPQHTLSKKINVLHLSSEKSWRGGEQQIAYLIKELNRLEINNQVACHQNSAFATYCQQQNWPFASLPFANGVDLYTALAIKNMCRQQKIDLVHIHSAKSHSIAVLSAWLGNATPLVLSRRVDFPVRRNRSTQWKYHHPSIRKIICVSEAIEHIVRRGIRVPDKCTTVHSGVDVHRFRPPVGYLRKRFSLPDTTLLVVNTSAIADHKDYFTFVDTAEAFQSSRLDARFIIIGDGPEQEVIRQYIAQKNLESTVLMTGFINNLTEILPEADIFLMTSKTEGLGTSVLDAFACRVPVVATRAGGIPEMVIHRETGLLAEVGDATVMAKHLETITQDAALKKRVVENAYQHLLNHFTKEKMASNTLNIYKNILINVN